MQEPVNHSEIAKIIGVLLAAYPTIEVPIETVKIYVRLLSDIPVEVLQVAVQQCIAESEFLPTISKLRDKAFDLSSDASRLPTAFEAWGIVLDEIQSSGFYRSPKFNNTLIARAVECIGWRSICSSENQVADRAHFVKVYEALTSRAINDAKVLPSVRRLREQAIVAQLVEATGTH